MTRLADHRQGTDLARLNERQGLRDLFHRPMDMSSQNSSLDLGTGGVGNKGHLDTGQLGKAYCLNLGPPAGARSRKREVPRVLLPVVDKILQIFEGGFTPHEHPRSIELVARNGHKVIKEVGPGLGFNSIDEVGGGNSKDGVAIRGLLGHMEHPLGGTASGHIRYNDLRP